MTTFIRFSILLLISAFSLPVLAQQSDSTATPTRAIYTVVQEQPEFPGGINKLDRYLRKNMRYPEAARNKGIQGRQFVAFVINEQGGLEDVHVLKSLDREIDAEAVRLVQSMPNWIPGKVYGKPVACRYNLVVNFAF